MFNVRFNNNVAIFYGFKFTDLIQDGGENVFFGQLGDRQPLDLIFADLKVFHTRVLVGVIYCPLGIDSSPFYGSVVEELSNRYLRHMSLVDFNVNLLGDSTSSCCAKY
jgi:hypothetical protein